MGNRPRYIEAMQGVVWSYDEATRKELASKSAISALRGNLKWF